MAGLTPIRVTAHLQQGIVLDTLFGTALDGLLASAVREREKAHRAARGRPVTGSLLDGGLAEEAPRVVPLPLARCDLSEDWHWLATTALPVDGDGSPVVGDPDVHHHHNRVRERVMERAVIRVPASLPPASGRYRMRRMPVVTTPALSVVWQAVGDPAAVADLLGDLPTIGRHRTAGEGTVLRWEVSPVADADPTRFGHCHPTGALGRPVVRACAQALGLPTDRTGTAGIRPPYWHPSSQRPVILPPLLNSPHP